jgi:hypothetical protein
MCALYPKNAESRKARKATEATETERHGTPGNAVNINAVPATRRGRPPMITNERPARPAMIIGEFGIVGALGTQHAALGRW